jgi:RNA polymerase sigma-70 factor (ECF subfamily)
METEEQIRRIRNSDERAFEDLFFNYYKRLCGFAIKIVNSRELAKDCVQEVFLKIWRNRENWEIDYSLSVYLYQAVRNQALNKVEKRKNKRDYTKKYYEEGFYKESGEKELSREQNLIIEKIWQIVEEMPERRRMVFELHRKHGLNYKEIACVMGIALKTVDNHMGKALSDIREQLGNGQSS